MNPRQLSHELRKGETADLSRRRWIIGLSMVGATMAQLVSIYQTGIISHLPDPPLSVFDSSRVDASNYAYKRYNSPDGPAMLVNYGLTSWIAAAGGKDRAKQSPSLPLMMGAKVLLDAGLALKLGQEEWAENKALCAYCQVATLCSLASVALAVPEVRSAYRAWRNS